MFGTMHSVFIFVSLTRLRIDVSRKKGVQSTLS